MKSCTTSCRPLRRNVLERYATVHNEALCSFRLVTIHTDACQSLVQFFENTSMCFMLHDILNRTSGCKQPKLARHRAAFLVARKGCNLQPVFNGFSCMYLGAIDSPIVTKLETHQLQCELAAECL